MAESGFQADECAAIMPMNKQVCMLLLDVLVQRKPLEIPMTSWQARPNQFEPHATNIEQPVRQPDKSGCSTLDGHEDDYPQTLQIAPI